MPAIQTTERTMPVGAGAGAGWSPQVEHGHHDHHDGGGSGMHAAMQHDGHGGMNHGGMDHGGMDHGGMDHGGMNHGGMDHGDGASMCKMSMVWNTDPTDLCLVFPWWRITSSSSSLYSSLFIVVLLGVGYEWLRLQLRRLDRRLMASGGAARRRRKRRGTAEGAATSSGRRSSPPTPGRLQQHRRVASVNSTQKGLLVSSLQDADDGNASGAGGSSPSLRRAATPSHLSDASGQDSDPATTATTPPYLAGRRHPTARRYVAVGGGQAGTATASVPLSAMFSIPALLQPLTRRQQLIRSVGYATSVGLSFLMMLLAMTYNSYVIGAVLIGAGIGHYLFQRPSAEKVGVDEDEQDAPGVWGEYVSDEDGEDVVDSKGMACH